MDKVNLVYEYTKDAYKLALTRRENIRNRTNIMAAFGFSVISLLINNILEVLGDKKMNFSDINNWYIGLSVLFFILFIVFYILTFGAKKITDIDPLEAVYKISDIQENDEECNKIYINRFHYYDESGFDKPGILAEDYVAIHYVSTLYAYQTNNIYDGTVWLGRFFNLMTLSIVKTIILLILMRGAI